MITLLEKLDNLLKSINEAEEPEVAKEEKPKVKEIPINPEMMTDEQGRQKAYEKIVKLFYDLSTGGMGPSGPSVKDDVELPDDFIDPKLKGKMEGPMKDTEFEKNKVIWDQDELDKINKDVEINTSGEDDDFDDFNYRDNEFGDDADTSELDTEDMDSSGGGGSSDDSEKSESEKLKDAIDKAIDKMRDEKESGGGDGSKSDMSSGDKNSDGSSKGSSSGESGSDSSSDGSSSGSSGSESQEGDGSGGPNIGGSADGTDLKPGKPMSAKDRKLKELKDALEKGDESGFDHAADELKEGEDGTGKLAGEHRDSVSNEDLEKDMKNAGLSEKDIKEMIKTKDHDTSKDYSDEEIEEIKKEVVDGLEKKCKKRGGSALAKTVVKNALKAKIENDEWKEMLKLFLKAKSIMKGSTSKAKNKTVYGHKNHLWRDSVLPTRTYGKGEIQKIYCFVDFSGSVNQDLVYTFLGRVIDLCQELSYTDVVVYGFGDQIVLPRKINGKMLKAQGRDVVLSQTWDYIQSQNPGGGSENFEDVAHEINQIRRKDKDSVFLIFGDALWSNYGNAHPPLFLKEVCGTKVLEDICVLTYYMYENSTYAGEIAYLRELVGLKSVITTKASSIRE